MYDILFILSILCISYTSFKLTTLGGGVSFFI
nr:MAG TPA: Protein of unknown function (DUF1056) [Caudoviricetes sp.]